MQRYENYKDSGIDWIGDIPEHWEIVPIKYSLEIPITDGPHETPKLLNKGIPFISAEAVKNDQLDFEKKRGYISLEDHQRFSFFQEVQAKAFGIPERQKLDLIADQMATKARFDETVFQWEHVDKLAHQFKRHLRPILRTVNFSATLAGDHLIEAIHFLKTAFGKGKPLGQYPDKGQHHLTPYSPFSRGWAKKPKLGNGDRSPARQMRSP
jgi:hypothetical protein